YLGLLALSAVIAIFEWVQVSTSQRVRSTKDLNIVARRPTAAVNVQSHAFWLIWIATLLPISSLAYLIYDSGSLLAYVLRTTVLVQEFRGAGIYIAAIKLMVPLNGLYWICLLLRDNPRRSERLIFVVHLVLLILLTAATGSRGTILTGFVILILAYHLLKRPLSGYVLGLAATMLILTAGILGVVRSNYSVTDEAIVMKSLEVGDYAKLGFTDYGIAPLELALNQPGVHRALGSTYASAITNFVPRRLWPDKLTTGGVYLTEKYADNRWGGTSYLSTGAITEGIINFGYVPGILVAFGFFVLVYLAFLARYSFRAYCFSGPHEASIAMRAFVVVNLTILLPNFLIGEFTNMVVQIVLRVACAGGILFVYRLFRESTVPATRNLDQRP
ncbi:MAG: hypothetical protein OEQ39_25400, partial [Gammaproteobacteria bacterium]|nr:hypothetical protein [Gammaproteobacteria bacterium]